ncbi:MAG: V-type ATP synthase subunit D [Planctomycetota bacterium]|jgi:V/A-type H+-transporting ATPase subunit D
MALALNKSSLKHQRDQLKMFRRFLPSLDLKRQQLLSALKEARGETAAVEREIEELSGSLERLVPLLGSSTLAGRNLASLVRVREVRIEEENLAGVRVPVARNVDVETAEYSTLATPFWVDSLVENLQKMATLRVRLEVQRLRLAELEVASRRITQRVNLFEKVLIPGAEKNIQRIRVFLSDEERAAVVRSKIAKGKQKRYSPSE